MPAVKSVVSIAASAIVVEDNRSPLVTKGRRRGVQLYSNAKQISQRGFKKALCRSALLLQLSMKNNKHV